MLVANSFDLWQRDTFFSAAEEVQQSADIMESAYRTWVREKREGASPQDLDEFSRELQTALGTAKWQLEEFERAVMLSYRNHADEITMARHRQFVDVIENQISHVEAALRDSFNKERKQPFQWVNLDEEERDDLALFLSGAPGISQSMNDKSGSPMEKYKNKEVDFKIQVTTRNVADQTVNSKDATCMMVDHQIIQLDAKEILRTSNNIHCQSEGTTNTRRTWSSPDFSSLKIVIDNGDEQEKASLPAVEDTPKEKGLKPFFWKQKWRDHLMLQRGLLSYSQLRGIPRINQFLGQVGVSQRPLQSPQFSRFGCSIQVKLAFVLTIFLIVAFVLHAT